MCAELCQTKLLTRADEFELGTKIQAAVRHTEERKKLAARLGRSPSRREWARACRLTVAELEVRGGGRTCSPEDGGREEQDKPGAGVVLRGERAMDGMGGRREWLLQQQRVMFYFVLFRSTPLAGSRARVPRAMWTEKRGVEYL